MVGSFYYALLLFVSFRFLIPVSIAQILLWNLRVFSFLGRGGPVGNMPDGSPIYDWATGLFGISWANISLGFLIYPILFFAILTIWNRFREGKRR